VRVCTLEDGRPVLHREIALRPGSGPRHLAFHPDGSHAYVLNELTPTVTVCRWDAESGSLKPLTEVPVLPGPPDGDAAYPSGIVTSPDGRFVWTATRGEDVLSVLAVEGDGLRLVGTVPCEGHWPRALAEADGPPVRRERALRRRDLVHRRPRHGRPARGGSIKVTAASCVVFD
jgi:6-phosphogluconolactonase